MPALTLSTGRTLLSENVKRAEFYPSGLARNNAVFSDEPARQDFLFIRTTRGAEHVLGKGAERDATALEQAGIRVDRRPKPAPLRRRRVPVPLSKNGSIHSR